MAFERFSPPKTSRASSSIVLLDQRAGSKVWREVGDFPDTPEGERDAETTMRSYESHTGYSYRIIRRVTREEIVVSWT